MNEREIYNLQVLNQDGWGINGYEAPKIYTSSSKDSSPHPLYKQSTNKGIKGQALLPVRGHYLDSVLAEQSQIPSSAKYNPPRKWALSHRELENAGKKSNQLNYHSDRKTFLDSIKLNQLRNPVPGPNAYQNARSDFVRRSSSREKDIQNTINRQEALREKVCYLSEIEHRAATTPGPGEYNPHSTITKVKVERKDCEYWKEKHKRPSPFRSNQGTPGVGIYNPLPANCKTFGKIQEEEEKRIKGIIKNGSRSKSPPLQKKGDSFLHSGFGSTRRDYEKETLESQFPTPGPGTHHVEIIWSQRPKSPSILKQKNTKHIPNPHKFVSKGVQRSIYYD